MCETPILLIIFNRPDTTQRVFEVVKQEKPKYLYVAADGPRPGRVGDIERCRATRAIIEQVDWKCELHTLLRDENKGCGLGPAEAISWFFKHVDEGIILEDDSVPHPDFFSYCAQLLNIYRTNDKIQVIGSANFQEDARQNKGSYYFSMQNGCFCSWATWKRTWDNYDYYLKRINIKDFKKSLKYYKVSLKEYIFWIDIFNQVKKDRANESCWDYQLMFSIWKKRGVAIVPTVNLATNIGFNQDATHTFGENHPGANKPSGSILPLMHPDSMNINRKADLYYHNYYYQPPVKGKKRFMSYVVIINKLIKSFLNVSQRWDFSPAGLFMNIYSGLASRKSEIKSFLFWEKQGVILRSKILDHYNMLPKENVSADEKEVVDYLKKHKISLLPYEFIKNYRKKIEVIWDSYFGLSYVFFENQKLYYRKDWNVKKIKVYHANLLAEQDFASPHRYLFEDFVLNNGDTLVDVGAAEGIFSLMNIKKVKKVFLFEPDPLWVEALRATFFPWIEKTVIIEKFVSSNDSNKTIKLDFYFKNTMIDFLKIDVEGWERDVLRGSENVLNRNHPLKAVIATYHRQGDEREFMHFFVEKGFKGSYSRGYVPFFYQMKFEQPYLRKCLIRAEKQLR